MDILLTLTLLVLSIGLIGAGTWMIYRPAALIVTGLIIFSLSIWSLRR